MQKVIVNTAPNDQITWLCDSTVTQACHVVLTEMLMGSDTLAFNDCTVMTRKD